MLKEGFKLSQTGGTLEPNPLRLGFTQMKQLEVSVKLDTMASRVANG